MSILEITVQQLKTLRDENAEFTLLDVRDPWEYEAANIGGTLIPLADLPNRLNELDPLKPIVVHCQMGGRSSKATAFLLAHGFSDVKNLRGGLMAWAKEIDPTINVSD